MSPMFHVTTVEDVYETYAVEASTPEAARRKVLDDRLRPSLPSFPAGADRLELIDVRSVAA